MNREKLLSLIEKGKLFVKSVRGKVIIGSLTGAIIGFNLGGATAEQLNAVEELPKIRVELQKAEDNNKTLNQEINELKGKNEELNVKIKEAEPFFKEKDKKEQEELKRKQVEEEKKEKAENEKKIAKQKESNKLVRDSILTIMKANYKGIATVGTREENGVLYFTITTQGFAEEALLYGKENPEYIFVKEGLVKLSEAIKKVADEGNSDETYGIAVLNDKNTKNVLLTFVDGVCTYEFD
ncbi:MAG: hypothetical protein ACRCX8_06585 [Sarcina sp.]